ncbi:MAG: hypothetical protein KDA92_21495 [Planctomycetales bacterium]|nr:hypothetical protein [Planctomycetales bacterium]MCA9171466.1 hypothetical protein [Planctomycetales bacterium]
MEFGRRSNLGSLISAVLVGLLALGANEYARLDPRKLDSFFAQFKAKPEPPKQQLPPPKPTVRSVTIEINGVERELFPLFGKINAHVLTADDEKLREVLKRFSATLTKLENDEAIQTGIDPKTQLALLRALFMAAELHSEPFAEPFSVWSQRLVDSSNHQLASQAAALSFFRENNLDTPDAQLILSQLERFSVEHPNPDLGIHFYLNVANQLVSRGHYELARTVIKLGADIYKGRPGTFRLVNWLIDHNSNGMQPN